MEEEKHFLNKEQLAELRQAKWITHNNKKSSNQSTVNRRISTNESVPLWRQAFIECDKNNDNFITTGELGWTMRVIGFNPTEAELQQLVNKVLAISVVENGIILEVKCLSTLTPFLSTIQTVLEKSSSPSFVPWCHTKWAMKRSVQSSREYGGLWPLESC